MLVEGGTQQGSRKKFGIERVKESKSFYSRSDSLWWVYSYFGCLGSCIQECRQLRTRTKLARRDAHLLDRSREVRWCQLFGACQILGPGL